MQQALAGAGFGAVSSARLPLVFKAPVGQFAAYFRTFAVRAAVMLDKQPEAVLKEIHAVWDEQLEDFRMGDEYHVPMPALAVSAVLGT